MNKQILWPADKVERWPIDRLVPYARNARTHSDLQVEQIAASIQEWGWTSPVLVGEDGGIIAGHARVLAGRKLGLAEVPVMLATGWSEAQKRAYVLADNQLALNAGWNPELLRLELGELAALDFDLGLIGFDEAQLAGLTANPGLTDPDEVPEPPAVPIAKLGEVWQLGRHRLMCGDSTKAADVAQLMDGAKAALFATDPPYLVDYTGAARPNDSGKDWSKLYQEIPQTEALPFFRAAFTNAAAVLEPNAAWYVWHAHKHVGEIEQIWRELDILNHMQIVWVKPTALHTHTYYPWQHEPCLMGWRRGHKPAHDGDNTHAVTSVWTIDWEGKSRVVGNEHPTQKPVELFARPMRKHTQPGAVCYEPFSGSGSQLIAGEQQARSIRAMELSPTFCDVSIERWQNFTGEKAKRVEAA